MQLPPSTTVMSSLSPTACIQPNPDISGIGVRVSIYAQAFLSLVPLAIFAMDGEITLEESLAINDIVMTNELTACALLVSAIIQARTYGLSTYHANIVLVLSWITFVPCMATAYFGPVLNRKLMESQSEADMKFRKRVAWKLHLRGLVVWVHYIAVAGLGIWVWSDVKTFGSQPDCTPRTFVLIFGYNIPVTNQGLRVVALYLYGSFALSAAIVPVYIPFMQYRQRRRARRAPPRPESPSDVDSYTRNRREKRNMRTWCFVLLLAAGTEILFVASTEVLITRSKGLVQSGESQWTFGQSLAVFLVLIPLVSTIGELQKGYEELREKRKREPLQPREA
ncbi:hypothetical protein GALMADRAFT_251684 [Galerina marginata CBS 339.88]|uniref:Uncharacterized protein n=1 Tax=Galerina marginata (strain CBS 339.88) TaxID=685588 RepID=A0A067SQF3_GALM3|nr:hypothetical protein GALMADRAFT_251684 [Galerina marginata CBS 339.88]